MYFFSKFCSCGSLNSSVLKFIKSKTTINPITKVKVSNSLLGLITNLGDKAVIKTRKTRGTFFYNVDDLNKVFSGWDKMRKMKVKVEFKNVSPQFKDEAMSRIKKRMIMMTDIGISKYQVIEDKLFKYYGKNKVKCSSF